MAKTVKAKKTKARKDIYFTSDVDEAIVKYNQCEDLQTKGRIYGQHIHQALDKLVENIINRYKFYRYDTGYEDLKHDVVSLCQSKLDRYELAKGKAYSFFTKIAYNELITRTKKTFKQQQNREELDVLDSRRDVLTEVYHEDREGVFVEFVDQWCEWCSENNRWFFKSEKASKAADSITDIIRTRKSVESFNKKALYILIRDQAQVRTQYITLAIAKMKEMFYQMYKDYDEDPKLFNWNSYVAKYRVKGGKK